MPSSLRALVVVALVIATSAAAASADLILTQSPPDITASFCGVAYDAESHELTIGGIPVTFDYNGVKTDVLAIDDTTSWLSLSLYVDNTGQLMTGMPGSITITGHVVGLQTEDTTLVSGNVVAFAADPSGGTLQMLFDVTSQDLPAPYAFGSQLGVIVSSLTYLDSGFNVIAFPGFSSNFANDGLANIDAFAPVPEPATLGLMMIAGGFGVVRWVRRRRAA